MLQPDGVLLIALVLPYFPFVEFNSPTHTPTERLQIHSAYFEDAANEFVSNILVPIGFRVLSISRLPYLSQGDYTNDLYYLDDLIVVASPNKG